MDKTTRTEAAGGRFLTVDGIRTHILDAGSADPVVLVHGLGGPLMWQRVVPLLRTRHRIILIDLPGFGESDTPPRAYSPSDYVHHVVHCLDVLQISRADLAGISYGGQISAELAADFPDRVRRLFLMCSTGLMEEQILASNTALWKTFATLAKCTVLRSRRLMCRFGKRSFYSPASRPADLCGQFYRQLCRPGARDAWLNAFRSSFVGKGRFMELLRKISAPTLIVWGERDSTVSPRYAAMFHELIAGSSVLMLPECAHSIPLEKPEELYGKMEKIMG